MSEPCNIEGGCKPVHDIHESLTRNQNSLDTLKKLAVLAFALLGLSAAGWGVAVKIADSDRREQLSDLKNTTQSNRNLAQAQAQAIVRIETMLPRMEQEQRAISEKLDALLFQGRNRLP